MKRLRIPGSLTHGDFPYASPEKTFNAVAFDYLSPDSAQRIPTSDPATVITALDALGAAMVVDERNDPNNGDADFSPIYTFWGQFIDHDITLNADRNPVDSPFDITTEAFAPVAPQQVSQRLANLRSQALNLDSVYAGGPGGNPSLYCPGDPTFHCCNVRPGAFLTGLNQDAGGETPTNGANPCRDLPRSNDGSGHAIIGDQRNDENLILAQFHLAMLRFHNAALDRLGDFERAREQTRLHHQWLVVNDYLKTVANPQIVDAVVHSGLSRYKFAGGFMPVEFTAAAFRFGHATVRSSYDLNAHFGRGGTVADRASLEQVLELTGNAHAAGHAALGGNRRLPDTWIADWSRLTGCNRRFNDGGPERRSKKIDSYLAEPLSHLPNEPFGEEPGAAHHLMQHLAQRNLRRGFLLSVPTGQAMAALADIAPLTAAQLLDDTGTGPRPALRDALLKDNELLLAHTPLWFYVLREAETLGGGNRLGPIGSHIVVETIVGLLRSNDDSYLNRNWSPSDSEIPGGRDIRSIEDFLQFAGVA